MTDVNTDKSTIDELLTRGVENIISNKDELSKRLSSGDKLNVYLGIDPTATKIHLGHAVSLRKIQAFAELGHNVTFLIGDFTALVGDTSDKDGERPSLTPEEIQQNFETYKEQASKFVDFDKVTLRQNSEWLSSLTFADLLKTAENFSVNDFISRDLIRKRLDEGTRVGLKETLYPLMQGYDSWHMDTDIQVGATDQTFNMQAGRTLLKRLNDKESFVFATGYLSGTDGRKMSKSWGNAIWLDDPGKEVFGKVMRIPDEILEEYFTLGTSIETAQIENTIKAVESGETHPMEAKKILARRITEELCGTDTVKAAEEHFVATVQKKEAGEDAETVSSEGLKTVSDIINLIYKHNLVESKSEARRLLDQNAIYLNDKPLAAGYKVEFNTGVNIVRVGKRRYINIER